ncbi:cytosine methyltransferase [Mycoplasma elephantis]|uniref:cytosine methyltransferase n=1 Tax=Mycoplasma elephantis TaxID=114882 RepID=UPI000A3DEDF0
MSNLPKPDIILASPPCESWSSADCAGKIVRRFSSDGIWEVKNKKYYDDMNKTCHPVKHRYFEQKERGRLIGEGTIAGTIFIINSFKPRVWIIENPTTSKTWEYQRNHWNFVGNENKTYYSAYDKRFSLKPTIFKSNIKLNLSLERKKSNNHHMAFGSYTQRSSIPKELIREIIKQCIDYMENKYK